MAFQTDKVQLIVGADTKGAVNQLGYLQAEYKKLEEAKKLATTFTGEQAINNAMSVMKEKIEAARKELGLMGLSQTELNRKIREHNSEASKRYAIGSEQAKQHKAEALAIKDVITAEQRDISTIKEVIKVNGIRGLTTQQLINYSKHLQDELSKESNLESELNRKRIAEAQQVDTLVSSRKNTINGAGGIFSNLKGNLLSATIGGIGGGVASAALATLSSAMDKVNQKIDQLATKSDALADLQLAFQATAEEAKAINKELGDIDTRTKNSSLRDIATQGGLLNVPREELQSFVQAADQAVTVMQKDFPGGVEETTNKLGKLKELFAETKDLSFGEAITKDASAIKTLADNGTATAGSMTQFAMIMGQLQESIRPTLTETLGLGAALEEAGISADTGATNLSKALFVSAANTDKVAGFFGKTRKEIEQLINTKPNEFLLELSKRLSGLNATDYAKTMKDLKLEDIQVKEVLGVLGTQIDNVRAKQDLASKSFEEGTRITEAFSIKNNTFGANLEKLSKNWTSFVNDSLIGTAFSNMTTSIVEGLNKLLEKDKSLTLQFDEQSVSVKKLDREVKPLLTKYDELSKNKSAENQAELKKVIGQIINIMPTASYEVDKYGNAISVNTTKTREFIEQQRAMLLILNKGLINETADKHIKARQELMKLSADINKAQNLPKNNDGLPTELVWGLTGSKVVVYNLQEMNKRAAELRGTINSTYLAWKGFKGEMVGGDKPEIVPPTKPNGLSPMGAGTSDKDVKDAKKLQEELATNEKKLIDDIEKMQIDAIDNEAERNKEKLKFEFNQLVDSNYKLVEEKKLSQESYASWVKAAQQKLDDDVAEMDEKAKEKQKKADLEAAQQTAKLVLDARLAQAEATGDEELVLQSKIALRKQQFDVDIEKATADQKLAVWEKYLSDVQKLMSDHEYKTGQNEAKGAGKLAGMIKKGTQEYIKGLDKDQKLLYDTLMQGQNTLFSVVDSRFQKQEIREKKSYDKSQTMLEKQLSEGVITQDEFEKKKISIEKRHNLEVAKIQRKQAIADKANALVSIATNTSIAASKVLGQTGMFGIPAVAFVIAQGALQAASVLAQPLPALPSLFVGGQTPDKFNFPVGDGKGGGLMIGHPNEFVLNARATSSPVFAAVRPILESANAGQLISGTSGGSVVPGAANNGNVFGDLTSVLSMINNTILSLEKRLENLRVYFGGSDYEHIGEEINHQKSIDEDAMIYNSKL